jgi:hypothetical protein
VGNANLCEFSPNRDGVSTLAAPTAISVLGPAGKGFGIPKLYRSCTLSSNRGRPSKLSLMVPGPRETLWITRNANRVTLKTDTVCPETDRQRQSLSRFANFGMLARGLAQTRTNFPTVSVGRSTACNYRSAQLPRVPTYVVTETKWRPSGVKPGGPCLRHRSFASLPRSHNVKVWGKDWRSVSRLTKFVFGSHAV